MGIGSSKIQLNQNQEYRLKKQQKNVVCNIKINNVEKGDGFLCFCPKTESRILITDTRTFQEKDINDKNEMVLILKNKENYSIDLKIPRAYYMNQKEGIIMLEIKEEDNLKSGEDGNFVEFDDDINNNDTSKYNKKNIYLLPFELEKEKFPVGKITKVNEKDDLIEHNCENIKKNILYAPILLLENYKVIGFNRSQTKGIFLKKFLDEFKKKEKELKKEIQKKLEEQKRIRLEEQRKSEEQKKLKEEEQKKLKEEEEQKKIEAQKKKEEEQKKLKEEEEQKKIEDQKIKEEQKRKLNEMLKLKEEKNKIILHLEIKQEDFGKEIYFLDSSYKEKKKIINEDDIHFMESIENYKNKIKMNITLPNKTEKKDMSFNNKFKPKKEDKIGNENNTYIIEIEFPIKIKFCGYMFYNCSNITEVDLSKFDASEVTKMNDMFSYCTNIKTIKFKKQEINNVTNMNYMFNYCKNLEAIDLSQFNTRNVTHMGAMFQNCEKLEKIDLSNFDTKNVIQFGCMFNDCYNLKEIIFSDKFTSSKAMFIPWMFYGCENLEKIDLTYFQIYHIQDRTKVFEGCYKLNEIKVKSDSIYEYKQLFPEFTKKFK